MNTGSYAREDPWLPGGGDHDLLAGIIRCSDRAVGTQTVDHTSLNVQNPFMIQVWDYQPGSAMPARASSVSLSAEVAARQGNGFRLK